MKVYVKFKKHDVEQIVGKSFAIVYLSAVSFLILYMAFGCGLSFREALDSYAIPLLFVIAFIGSILYILYSVLFKKLKCYKAKLIDKKVETYKNQQITSMKFTAQRERTQEEHIPVTYECYSIGENDLVVGNEYSLKMKETNWKPKYVDQVNESTEDTITDSVPEFAFFLGEFVLGGIILICILGILLYPEYTAIYIAVAILIGVLFFKVYKLGKEWDLNYRSKNKKDRN